MMRNALRRPQPQNVGVFRCTEMAMHVDRMATNDHEGNTVPQQHLEKPVVRRHRDRPSPAGE